MTSPPPFLIVEPDGNVRFRFHRSQARAMKSDRRFVAIVAGAQSGKSECGPPWLHREMKLRGPGDYMVVTPDYQLLAKKALPVFRRLFETLLKLGKYNAQDHIFPVSPEGEIALWGDRQSEETRVHFGYAAKPESLEAATAKAAWCDEAGQKDFKLASWQAILRRLSIHEGRVLITTTPYDFGWLKQKLYDPWKAGSELIEFVNFESRDNPAFPQREWERAKLDMPRWKFDLMYRGIFTKPAGVIFDNFESDRDKCAPFTIDPRWHRYLGMDFGGVNTVGLFYAQEPGSNTLYLYREYKAGSRTASQHVEAILAKSRWFEGPGFQPLQAAGGSKSEDQWRDEFAQAGLGLDAPDFADVEVGIDRVYGFHAREEVKVFSDCEGYLEEKATYRRKLDALDQPTPEIQDKSSFHYMDAERYILSKLATPEVEAVEVMFDFDESGGFVYE